MSKMFSPEIGWPMPKIAVVALAVVLHLHPWLFWVLPVAT